MRRASLLIALVTAICLAAPSLAGWDQGLAAFTSEDYQQAMTEFQELVGQNPDGWRGHYMLGRSLEQMKRAEEALHHLRKAYDLNPNDLSVKVALGRAYFNQRRYGDVDKLLGTIDAGSLPTKQQAAFYQIRGQAKFRSEDGTGALADFAALAKLRPDHAQTHYTYGTTALSLGRTDEGIAALARAVQLAPEDTQMSRVYTQALIRKGRSSRDKAVKAEAYARAADIAGGLVAAEPSYENQILKISAELGGGLYTDAVATGEVAVSRRPDDWLVHYYLGQAYSSNKQYAEAEMPLTKARSLSSDPDDLRVVWRQLGFVYEKQKKYSQAIDAYQNSGDQAGVARVRENEKTAAFNRRVEAENQEMDEMKAEVAAIEAELDEIKWGRKGNKPPR